MSGGQSYYQPGLVRMRPKTEVSRHSVIQRYSGDFDLLTRTAARENNNNAARTSQFSNTNMFRRAKSSEWDRDVLNNNISDLRMSRTLTDFHLGNSNSNMQTLDKRISASTDQLDSIRESARDGGDGRRPRQYNRHDYPATKHRGEKYNKNADIYFGKSEQNLQRERGGRKTPFEIFLEDDGPYSRKLYGPVQGESKPKPSEKVTGRHQSLSSLTPAKSTEYIDSQEFLAERDVRSISAIKKGLLWQQRDKLFSRWKERFFILTNDYFHCFKKGSFKVTEMGEFIFKVKLSSITSVTLLDKRGFLTICLTLGSIREGRIYLRRAEGLRDWFSLLKMTVEQKKSRQQSSYFPETKASLKKKYYEDDAVIDDKPETMSTNPQNVPKGINRLSLVTDLLMSEAVRYYTRNRKENSSEDSGVESGNSLENNGSDSQTDSGSEHSSTEKDKEEKDVEKETMLVCHL